MKREQYAIQKQQQMKDNAKAEAPQAISPNRRHGCRRWIPRVWAASKAALKYSLPFKEDDRLLLIGEGDFSFAASIVREGFAKFFIRARLMMRPQSQPSTQTAALPM